MDQRQTLRQICAEALKIDIKDLDETQSWVAHGGDSMATIGLIARCEERGMRVKTADVIQCSSIAELFEAVQIIQSAAPTSTHEHPDRRIEEDTDAPPFALWAEYQSKTTGQEKENLLAKIDDIYPCTPLQEGLMALTARTPAAYVDRRAFALPRTIDIVRFRAAWETLVARTPILRTRIIVDPASGRALQVVTRDKVGWREEGTMEAYLEEDRREGIKLGQPLSRCGLVGSTDAGRGDALVFIWTVHHSIYDGWSALRLYRQLAAIYHDSHCGDSVSYTRFVRYLQQQNPDAATRYWRDQLQGDNITVDWPALPTTTYQPRPRAEYQATIPRLTDSASGSVMMSAVLRGAWAVIMAQFSGNLDVAFGATLSGRNAPVAQVADITAPLITTVPVRIQVDKNMTVGDFLRSVQEQASRMIDYEHTGLQQIKTFVPECASVLDFRNLLVIQPAAERDLYEAFPGLSPINIPMDEFDSYALNLECTLGREEIDVQVKYDDNVITPEALAVVMDHFAGIVQAMCREGAQKVHLNEIMTLAEGDREQITQWNADVPLPVVRCIHDLVENQIVNRPTGVAIEAWDGKLTYSELGSQSLRLAHFLRMNFGVKPEQPVALCMAKSKWAVVAMLAILYAGGAVLPISGNHPMPRLQAIMADADAEAILVDVTNAPRLTGLPQELVTISEEFIETLPTSGNAPNGDIRPTNMAWVMYTSGSTGTPKGVVLEHQSLCTSLTAHARGMGIDKHTRTLQFAAYTFDVSIMDIFSTLQAGGCVCIPSEEERLNDLAGAAARMEVNYAELTSTVAEMLSPALVPSLKTLVLSGEPLKPTVLSDWADHTRVFNSYGPSECSITTSNSKQLTTQDEARNIGLPLQSLFWVVDPTDHNTLCPIGTPGELLIEGPLVARGYLNDPLTTRESFITDPAFLDQPGLAAKGRRMYRTGDLVQQNRDGSLLYLGRCGGQQVKIRGQRVDVGEVESQILLHLQGARTVAVEVVAQDRQLSLIAIVVMAGKTPEPTTAIYQSLRGQLLQVLPQYMVPTLYMPVDQIPMNASGKLDRRVLRARLQELTGADLEQYALNGGAKTAPSTDMEKQLQALWAQTVGVAPASIGRDDSFILLGGDSIAAMRMVSLPAAQALQLTVADVFQHPQLCDLASVLGSRTTEQGSHDGENDPEPFALWSATDDNRQQRMATLATQCGVAVVEIEDILPSTSMQEGLMATTRIQPTAYIGRQVHRLAALIDTKRFQQAWQTLVACTPILRTRLAHDQHSSRSELVQVVVKSGIAWRYSTDLDAYIASDQEQGMALGQPLVRLALIQNEEDRFFVWTGHHSVYDGWSASLMYQQLAQIYHQNHLTLPSPPYRRFVHHLMQQDRAAAASYWSGQLDGDAIVDWPPLPRANYQPRPMHREVHTISLSAHQNSHTHGPSQLPNILRAAWPLVMATYSGGDGDRVVFGATLSGRNAPVRGIADMVGPTVTTIPVAVSVSDGQTVSAFLNTVQKQAADMIPFEHTGLQLIRKIVPESCHAALEFRNLFLVQPLPSSDDVQFPGLEALPTTLEGFDAYGLTVQCSLGTGAVTVEMRYDNKVLSTARVKRLLNCFDHLVTQLSDKRNDAVELRQLSFLSRDDAMTIAQWNATKPEAVKQCIHHLIETQIASRADALAIHAWDGDLTYAELGLRSAQLSQQLRQKGVRAERMVGVCMNKSKWAGVAMLAVLQAGGVVVPLGTTHPGARIAGIVDDTNIEIVLVDSQQQDRLSVFSDLQLVVVDHSLFQNLAVPTVEDNRDSDVTPDNAAWVIYTSGSTGKPKGVVLQHRALCSSIWAHGRRFKMGTETRMFQFAAHTFDACIQDYFTTLAWGGVVCVPSEEQRMSDLTATVARLGVTFATLTSTVARLIDPHKVHAMEQLALVGEPVKADVVNRWLGHVTVLNAYGPSECSIHSTCSEPLDNPSQSAIIGKGMGSRVWVVDTRDYNRLSPIGVPGELLIEGPILAREYLNDPVKSASAFIFRPAFLDTLGISTDDGDGRMYRTGDLVRLNHDGSLTHLGRLDTQVKIRGQRVEIGEIEYQITQQLPGVRSAAVELLHEGEEGGGQGLVSKRGIFEPTPFLCAALEGLRRSLFHCLPTYMVPSSVVPILEMPLNASGKLDRRAVRALLERIPSVERHAYLSTRNKSDLKPRTPTEQQLQTLWADMLQVSADQIGMDDDFFQIGGDSVVAMRMVATNSARALQLTVADIFQSPDLAGLAEILSARLSSEDSLRSLPEEEDPIPFSLWATDAADVQHREKQLQQIAQDCNIAVDTIQDVYPCTALQEDMMAVTARQPSAYINRQVFELDESIDEKRLQHAWERLAADAPALRTRIVMGHDNGAGFLQVVINEGISWTESNNVETCLQDDQAEGMGLGTRLIRFALVREEHPSVRRFIVWTAHHSLYDGWSTRLIYQKLAQSYNSDGNRDQQPTASASVPRFIRYLAESNMAHAERETANYWSRQLQGEAMSNWPPLPRPDYQPRPDREIISVMPLSDIRHGHAVTLANIVRAAWALTMAQYAGQDDVVFAATVSGRNAPVRDMATIVAPTITTVPVRARIPWNEPASLFLESIQRQAAGMIPYEHTGLRKIRSLVPSELAPALDLRNVLVVQTADELNIGSSPFPGITPIAAGAAVDFDSHGLTVDCTVSATELRVAFRYDEIILPTAQAENILSHLSHLVQQLSNPDQVSGRALKDVHLISARDRVRIYELNNAVDLSRVDTCIHALVAQQAQANPDAPAVCAWDGELSYGDLTMYATRLAHRLVGLGVGIETNVGVCMDKSRWAIVAMIAILQAGGVVVPLGVSHPVSRLEVVLLDCAASLILVDPQHHRRLEDLPATISRLVITTEAMENFPSQINPPAVGVSPDHAAWIIYTSGSTGTPKGMILEHGSVCTSQRMQAIRMNISNKTRALQFSPFTFDVSISDICGMLVYGGCVCLPSETDRMNNLAGSIQTMNVNFASLTPTVARLLSPAEVPTLRTLALTGEAVKPDVVSLWAPPGIAVYNTYGPAEGSVCTSNGPLSSPDEADIIGTPMATRHWVTQPDNYTRLCPIGAPGELLIEGPLIARGYVNNPDQTAASFVAPPDFIPAPSGCRLYRTGDLVRQNIDGTFTYLGRRDTQVKVRGQRVEIGEIEHQIVRHLSEAQVAVVCLLEGQGLVAAIEIHEPDTAKMVRPAGTIAPYHELQAKLADLRESLLRALPDYMVPAIFVPLTHIPTNVSGKLDRRAVHGLLSSLPATELGMWTAEPEENPHSSSLAPSSEMEQTLQELCGRALGLPIEQVNPHSDFFRLGGDSVAAMRMVAAASRTAKHLKLVVVDIFQYPRMVELAHVLEQRVQQNAKDESNEPQEKEAEADPEPFALFDEALSEDVNARFERLAAIAEQCGVGIDQVQDVYPCTPLQEGMLANTSRQQSAYVSRQAYLISRNVDLVQFKCAWEVLARSTPILRTRIVTCAGVTWQVVLDEKISWLQYEGTLEGYPEQDKGSGMGLGQPLTRYALIQQPSGEQVFVWTAHHSVYDGWTVRLLGAELIKLYNNENNVPRPVPYTRFIRYLQRIDQAASTDFWRRQLEGDEIEADWPRLPHVGYEPKPRSTVHVQIATQHFNETSRSGIVRATVLRAAWSLVMAQFSGHDDVAFAANVSGRTAPLPEITDIMGPTIATVPVRVRLSASSALTVEDYLQGLQTQANEMIKHEPTGVLAIRNQPNLTLRNLLVIQPAEDSETILNFPGIEPLPTTVEDFDSYALNVECVLGKTIRIQARFDDNVVTSQYMQRVLDSFAYIVEQLCDPAIRALPLNQLSLLNPRDQEQIALWNGKSPDVVDRCVHELVEEQAMAHPTKLAVWAWDGQFTYAELVRLALSLAEKLLSLGIGPESMVAVCMEKSKWAAVAFLAVLMAGGVVVPLGITHPLRRIEAILDDTRCDLVLVDVKQHQRLAQDATLPQQLLVVDKPLAQHITSHGPPLSVRRSVAKVISENAAWVIYTSGTTGQPKGAVLQHRAISSSIRAHGTRYKFGPHTRKLQYAAHTFDGAIEDYFTTLSWGGLCCVPSEEDRLDTCRLTAFMRQAEVNAWATTYTVAGLVHPGDVPSLRTLVLGGEPATIEVTNSWRTAVNLYNCYGPSECTIFSSAAGPVLDVDEIHNIGYPIGTRLWVANPDNANQLCALGAPGELLIEGPQLARGYLNDDAKTDAAFLSNLAFMGQFNLPKGARVYRSGDIVRQKDDGSLVYVARRNTTQVKIRGQRVEVGEIEYQIARCLPEARAVAVELLKQGAQNLPMLVAVVDFIDNSSHREGDAESIEGYLPPSAALQHGFQELQALLFQVLPNHMVPSVYLPLVELPRNLSGKLDRRALREMLDRVPLETMHQYLAEDSGVEKAAPSTEMERTLQSLWTQVLGIENIVRIGAHDNFFQMGGDSVAAMRLAATVQQEKHLDLTVGDILSHAKLSDMAALLTDRALTKTEKYIVETDPEPLSLLPMVSSEDVEAIAAKLGVATSAIGDIYPATALQEGFVAVTSRQSAAYVSRQVYRLSPALLDIDRFKKSWEVLVDATPILRTRLSMRPDGRAIQVVVQGHLKWRTGTDLSVYHAEDRKEAIALNTPLMRYGIVTDQATNCCYFVWTAHHSIYDAWTLRAITNTLADIYNSTDLYVTQVDEEAMKTFWSAQLAGDWVADWPPLPQNEYQPLPRGRLQKKVQLPQQMRSEILDSTILRAAWSIVMSQYAGSSDVVFAATLSGRNAPIAQINKIAGPTLTTVPIRVSVDKSLTVNEFLHLMQKQSTEMIPYEQTGLQTIKSIQSDANQDAPNLRNILIIQLAAEAESSAIALPGLEAQPTPFEDFGSFGLQIECTPMPGSHRVDVDIQYDEKVISSATVAAVADHFVHLTQQLFNPGLLESSLGEIQCQLSPVHAEMILQHNRQVPSRVKKCIHEMMLARANLQPDMPAVVAWDGDWTYAEITDLATSLASHLACTLRITTGEMVGVCMDKSKWAPVAMLAILLAGGAVVPLGVNHPPARIEAMAKDTGLGSILVDKKQRQRLQRMDHTLLVVDEKLMKDLPFVDRSQRTELINKAGVTADHLAWVIYTSGSTGTPKGVMLEHGALATSIQAHGAAFGFNTTTRVLQFAAHTFDATIQDIFTTLYHGGCVCIPSEYDRVNRLSQSMAEMSVTCASLTSTVASLLDPGQLPSMQTIMLVGEPVTPAAVKLWSPHATVLNAYGPSECSIHSSCSDPVTDPASAPVIGRPLASCFWVVDPENYHALRPVGAPGELLIEGPIQARGYLNDFDKTNTAFVRDAEFMQQLSLSGNQRRLYRTGDLVRQNENGTFTHMGRKDLQVKIRGQRVEVGEVEYQVQRHLPGTRTVAVEPWQHGGDDKHITLIAIMDFDDDAGPNRTTDHHLSLTEAPEPLPVTDALRDKFRDLAHALVRFLPAYMVPAAYLPISHMPMNVNNKLDRRAIRELLSRHSLDELQRYLADSTSKTTKTAPRTGMEHNVHALWVEVFGVPADGLGIHDNFLQLGGDSLTAMRMVAVAGKHLGGVRVSVEDIFTYPTVAELASILEQRRSLEHHQGAGEHKQEQDDPAPFQLWAEHSNLPIERIEDQLKAIAVQCGVDPDCIEDVYPCSPLQAGLMGITARQPAAYVSRQVYALDRSTVNRSAFQQSWEGLAASHGILRTRIVMPPDGSSQLLQVVVREGIQWEEDTNLEHYLRLDTERGMMLSEPLVRYGMIEEPSGKSYFVWTAHHALYDGWSMAALSKCLADKYHNRTLAHPAIPYSRFIRYLQHSRPSAESSAEYWREQLQGDVVADWPRRPAVDYQPMPRSHLDHTIQLKSTQTLVTTPTVLRAAWALVLTQYAGHRGVVFAATVSGRNAPVSGIADVMGPTITTVPVRTCVDVKQSVAEYLRAVQKQAIEMVPYEHTGLQSIKALVPDLASTLDVGTLMVIHPANQSNPGDRLDSEGIDTVPLPTTAFNSHAITLECRVSPQDIALDIHYDADIIAPELLSRVIGYFSSLVGRMSDPSAAASPVADILTISENDKQQIYAWNSTVPPRLEKCIHELVEEQVARTPDAIAIDAWDGQLTYRSFYDLAASLAHHLVSLGVGPETLVGVCMAKSKWGAVAMLAIMQAGGAIMPLGVSQPLGRIQTIIDTSNAAFILVDSEQETRLGKLRASAKSLALIAVDGWVPSYTHALVTGVTPDNASWAIFTSGSTGIPKGVIIEHGTMSTSLIEQGHWLGLDETTRFLQFASYTFDNVITDTFATTIFGGCVCIPSESDRMDRLADVIGEMRVNMAMLTSTTAQQLFPDRIPLLKKLILTGEPVRADVVSTWLGRAEIYNAYGPTEGSMSTCTRPYTNALETSNIGHGLATRLWVVQRDNPNYLSAIGAPGELYIEGPFLARGYLNDPAKTDAVFLADPTFTQKLGLTNRRVYRTGDLVRQNEDGTLIHLGRCDSQIKIRGQRVEISEIEYQITHHFPDANTVAVFILDHTPSTLVAAVELASDSPFFFGAPQSQFKGLLARTEAMRISFTKLHGALSQILPIYMVPTIFIPIAEMSRNLSGKLDRRLVQTLIKALPTEELRSYQLGQGPKLPPSTAMERQLRTIWAQALSLDADQIGAHDNYFHIGGDSLTAMRIIATARSCNLKMTVADMFKYPCLSELAHVLEDRATASSITAAEEEDREIETAPPFSLVAGPEGAEAFLKRIISRVPGYKSQDVVDILPTTDFQAMTIAEALATPGTANFAHFCLDGDGPCDVEALRRSCLQLIEAVPPLRTAYVFDEARLLQVILRAYNPDIPIIRVNDSSIDKMTTKMINKKMSRLPRLGRPFTEMVIIEDLRSNRHRVVFRLTHAEYDAVSMAGIWQHLISLYEGRPVRPRPTFASFLYTQRDTINAQTYKYWCGLLHRSAMTPVRLPTEATPSTARTIGQHPMKVEQLRPCTVQLNKAAFQGSTNAMVIKAAWALVLGRLSTRQDVIFAETVSTRGTVDESLMDATGCCVTLLPVRAKLNPISSINDILQSLGAQQGESLKHAQLGFREILHECTDWPTSTRFTSAINCISDGGDDDRTLTARGARYSVSTFEASDATWTVDLGLTAVLLDDDQAELRMSFLPGRVSENVAYNYLYSLREILETVILSPATPVSEILSTGIKELVSDRKGFIEPRVKVIGEKEAADHPRSEGTMTYIGLKGTRDWEDLLGARRGVSTTVKVNTLSFSQRGGDLLDALWLASRSQDDGRYISARSILEGSRAEENKKLALDINRHKLGAIWAGIRVRYRRVVYASRRRRAGRTGPV
ncbi:hypothetical protein BJX65DRAFT_311044 [Aspergillus insuetus]